MTDTSMTDAIVQAADLKSVELLFDYTKFHIGVYLTLASAFITLASLKRGDYFVLEMERPLVYIAMFFFIVAGLAGGVIISSITQCYGYAASQLPGRCASTSDLLAQPLGPWNLELFSGKHWTWIEHTSFWLGLLAALISFRPKPSGPEA